MTKSEQHGGGGVQYLIGILLGGSVGVILGMLLLQSFTEALGAWGFVPGLILFAIAGIAGLSAGHNLGKKGMKAND